MSEIDLGLLVLVVTAFLAAVVNGGFGFGFSSITVPIALAVVSNRVLNPALVLIEVLLNLLSLWLNRGALRSTWRRTVPLLLGVLPGVVLGSAILAVTSALWLKAATYAVLLPLVLQQFAGARWRVPYERLRVGVPAGAAIGLLYSTTTISGPPLAILFGSQELSQDEFRASMALARTVESSCTLVAYLMLGLVGPASLELFTWLFPAVLVGVPLGRVLLRRLNRESFRRAWISVDLALICFGLALVLHRLGWVDQAVASAGATSVVGFIAGSEWQRSRLPRGEVTIR